MAEPRPADLDPKPFNPQLGALMNMVIPCSRIFAFFRLFSHFSIHCHSYSVSDTIGLYIAMMRKLVQPIRTILQHFATVICYWLFSHFLIFRRQWSRF